MTTITKKKATHILYHHPLSICSIMVRYAFACRGEAVDGESEVIIQEEIIDILHGEQLSEHFLCDINANGEVPVLVPTTPESKPLPDSLAITQHISKSYPSLIPEAHAEQIEALLKELHDISFFALTFTGRPEVTDAALGVLRGKLREEGISERYRAACEGKIERLNKKQLPSLLPPALSQALTQTHTLLQNLTLLLSQSSTNNFFSLPSPSALDAHVIVFIARLVDIGRGDLVPEGKGEGGLLGYARRAWGEGMWRGFMGGGSTDPRPPRGS